MTNEEGLQEVIRLYLEEIKRKGVCDPDTTALTKELTALYELYQKDKDLSFSREKFQEELLIEQAKIQGSKVEQFLKAAASVVGTTFNVWVTKCVLGLETEGVVGSFSGKKIFSSMLGKAKTE